jgi:type I restriction enzyme, S subunit
MTPSTSTNGSVRKWRRYPTYSAPGSEWIAELPSHWQVKRLKHVAIIQTGLTLGKDYSGRETVTRPYLRVANVQDGYLDLGKITEVSVPVEDVARHELRPGDVLMTEGGDFDKLGRGYVWDGQIGGCLHQNHIFAVRPKYILNPRFLASLMTSDHGKNYFTTTSQQTTNLASTNSTKLKNFPLPLPCFEEQEAILGFLDRETAKINGLIAKKERLIELLQEKRTALISQAAIKGLDPNAPTKESGVDWVQWIPQHWRVRRNGFLFSDRDERDFPELPILEVSIHTGVKVRKFSDEHVEQKAEDPATYKRSLKGDVVFNKMRMWQGAVGVSPVDGLVSPDYQVCEPRNGVCTRYFEQLFRTSFYMTEINRYSHGIVMDRNRLYWDQFKQMPSLLPPHNEQLEIVAFMDETTERTNRLIAKVREGIEKLREYRTALISAAVTGKIDVRDEVS